MTTDGGQTDPFTKFWSDMMAKMSSTGIGMPFEKSQEAAMKAMRQAFFDAWEGHCVEFMRSEAFLDVMKKSMDAALTFKEQMNDFLAKAWQDSQIPTRGDTDSILQVLRGLEERVLDQLGELSKRVQTLEQRVGRPGTPAAPSERPTKRTSR